VQRLYLDTVTYGPAPLRLALERVGPKRLLYGSDRPPVPLDHVRTIGYVRELGLSVEDEDAVLGENARTLFGLN
jgi:predicted TIM-barrel fold metal-dependent hydrolase